jgi:hypothetical protein
MQKAEKNLVLRVNFIPSAGLKASARNKMCDFPSMGLKAHAREAHAREAHAREAHARERGYTFFITYVTTPQILKSLS